MDWIDEKAEKIRRWIQDLPMKRALAAYLFLALTAAFVCAWMTEQVCLWNIGQILKGGGIELYDGSLPGGIYSAAQNAPLWQLTQEEMSRLNTVRMVEKLSPWFFMCAWMLAAVCMFYRRRMKQPLDILKSGADEMGKKNLGFQISYDSRDEMGQLCRTFEQMRLAVVSDREELWRMIGDQKEINAAFAHDMRTPLTVLRGYTELLGRYVPEGRISKEKLCSTLELMSAHLKRLEEYTKTMRQIRSFEEIEPAQKEISFTRLLQRVREIVRPLDDAGDIRIGVRTAPGSAAEDELLWLDDALFLEIFENLLSNALRYADKNVDITLETDRFSGFLFLYVHDDGAGFAQEELLSALSPYYRGAALLQGSGDNGAQDHFPKGGADSTQEHFGIGLHICRVLAEKHGGRLDLANGIDGGALAGVSFFCRKS